MNEEIIMVSRNKDKIREVQGILKEYKILSMSDLDIEIEIEEDEETFEKNAIKKAETIAKILEGRKCLADDSGIEIEFLNGFPGVETKRWKKRTEREKNIEILGMLKDVPKEKRGIKFLSAFAISDGKNTISAVGELKGIVSTELRGNNGFGFDEIFELTNGKTLAELSPKEKNMVSARKLALEVLLEKVEKSKR